MVNRYIKLTDQFPYFSDYGLKVNQCLKIFKDKRDTWDVEIYGAFSKKRVKDGEAILMPEGWTPDNVDNNCLLNLQIW